jgi:hypothetical protein
MYSGWTDFLTLTAGCGREAGIAGAAPILANEL